MDAQLRAVVERVERLEAEVRRWRRRAAVLALAVIAVGTMGALADRRVVEARRFVVRDSLGRVRAELGGEDTSIALRVRDETGVPRLTVGVESEAAVLVLSDATGRPRAGLVTLGHGAPGLTLYDAGGRPRAEVGLARDGEPAMALTDPRGGPIWKTP